MGYKSTEIDGVEYFIEEDDVRTIVLKKQNGQLVEVPVGPSPRGELGSVEVYTAIALPGISEAEIPNCAVPVIARDRPLKVSVSVTLASTVEATLGGLVIYEDNNIVGFVYWTSPSNNSYDNKTRTFRVKPSPGPHTYKANLANFSGTGLLGIFSSDSSNRNPGIELIVEEI